MSAAAGVLRERPQQRSAPDFALDSLLTRLYPLFRRSPTGNKADLEAARAVTADEAQAYASEAGLFFLETSAKTAANVNELFTEIARKLPKAEAGPRQPQGGIVLDSAPAQQTKKAGCCS